MPDLYGDAERFGSPGVLVLCTAQA